MDILALYCRAQDRCDGALLASLFHDDAVDEHGGLLNGGVDDLVRMSRSVRASCSAAVHTLGQVLIDIRDDIAWSEAYISAFHRYTHDSRSWDSVWLARALDRFERRDDCWKIARRKVVYDCCVDRPTSELWAPGLLSEPTLKGALTPDDASDSW